MGRKAKKRGILSYLLALLVLAALVGAGWLWWHMRSWTPSQDIYPSQGILIGAQDGTVDFRAFTAIGADFAYLEASSGVDRKDPSFATNLRSAIDSDMQVGAVHRFDPCAPAEKQTANFVTVVPRNADLLPTAIELDDTAENCPDMVNEAMVESELMTFLNQIEGHTGKPVLLKITPQFEKKHALATQINRNLWLNRDRYRPDYGGRPWTLWTANRYLQTIASDEPVRWLVVQP